MKKPTFLFAMLALTGISVVIINACSKSETGVEANKGYQYTEFMPDQGQVIPLITQFNESFQARKQGLKSGEDFPLNEALWMLEAGVNYEFRSEKDSIVNVEYDTVFMNAGLIEDETGNYLVTGDDLMTAYEYLLASTNEILSMGEEPKQLLLADVAIKEVADDQVIFGMTTGIGIELPRMCEVKPNDYWYAASCFGQCGEYQGQNYGLDASNRINELLNARHCMKLGCANGGTLFFTSIDTLVLYEGNGPNGFLFWSGDAMECLDPNDIEYWWAIAEDGIEENKPVGKVFIDVNYTWDFWYEPSTWFHKADPVRYGIVNCTGTPDE
jgi:hypothetical protein